MVYMKCSESKWIKSIFSFILVCDEFCSVDNNWFDAVTNTCWICEQQITLYWHVSEWNGEELTLLQIS